MVAHYGVRMACDAWRILADGFSMRPQNLHALLMKAMGTNNDVADKDLQGCIAEWERDADVYVMARGEQAVKLAQHKMLLQMCSPALRAHLRMLDHLIPDTAAMR